MRFQVLKFYVFFTLTVWTNIAILAQIWDHISKTVFQKIFFFVFIESSKLSRNTCKMRVKLQNATI